MRNWPCLAGCHRQQTSATWKLCARPMASYSSTSMLAQLADCELRRIRLKGSYLGFMEQQSVSLCPASFLIHLNFLMNYSNDLRDLSENLHGKVCWLWKFLALYWNVRSLLTWCQMKAHHLFYQLWNFHSLMLNSFNLINENVRVPIQRSPGTDDPFNSMSIQRV